MGIRTARIDALTFGLGSGIAGIAGVALSQIDNVCPNLGQGYIIDSFMVVVFGGVGNLWGTLVGALSLGIANKFLEPFAGAVLGKIAHPGADHPVHPEAPARACSRSRAGRSKHDASQLVARSLDRGAVAFLRRARRARDPGAGAQPAAAAVVAVPRADLSAWRCSASTSATRCSRSSIDLIWGYCGILSLGHGAFFALGGYAMGMYLMRQIGTRGVYANPILPDFMVFLNWNGAAGLLVRLPALPLCGC